MINLSDLAGLALPPSATDQPDELDLIEQKLFSGITNAPYSYPRSYHRHDVRQHTLFNSRNNERWEFGLRSAHGKNLKASFWLLNDFMPKYLSNFTMLARLLEPEIFHGAEGELRTLSSYLYGPEMMDPNETPLSHVIRLSECSRDKLIEKLEKMNASPEAFFDNLTNLHNGALLLVLEHRMHEQVLPELIRLDFCDRQTKQRFFGRLLLKLGASRTIIRKITGISHNTFNLMYRDFEMSFPDTVSSASDIQGEYDPTEFLAILQDPSKCRFSSLIVSLYIICMRATLNLKATFKPMVLKGIPRELSYCIAAGCYECVRRTYFGVDYQQWTPESFREFFPSFNGIVALLQSLLARDTAIVGCGKCHTPYFVVTSDRLRRKCSLGQHCPKCDSCADYDPA